MSQQLLGGPFNTINIPASKNLDSCDIAEIAELIKEHDFLYMYEDNYVAIKETGFHIPHYYYCSKVLKIDNEKFNIVWSLRRARHWEQNSILPATRKVCPIKTLLIFQALQELKK